MSKKTPSAVNQQGSPLPKDPSETTRRAPLSKKEIRAYLLGALHDGTFSGNKRFRISQKGKEWLIVLQVLFKRLGYNSWIYKEGKERDVYIRVNPDYWRIYVLAESQKSFVEKIGSWHPRKIKILRERMKI